MNNTSIKELISIFFKLVLLVWVFTLLKQRLRWLYFPSIWFYSYVGALFATAFIMVLFSNWSETVISYPGEFLNKAWFLFFPFWIIFARLINHFVNTFLKLTSDNPRIKNSFLEELYGLGVALLIIWAWHFG